MHYQQQGSAQLMFIFIAAGFLLIYLTLANIVPVKNSITSLLYPIPSSFAAKKGSTNASSGHNSLNQSSTITLPNHIVSVRQGLKGGEFYNVNTDQSVILRGNDYTILGNQLDPFSNSTVQGQILFDSGDYDPNQVESILTTFAHNNYNVIRVFISENTVGDAKSGLSSTYLNNVADFLNKAKANNIFVIVVLSTIPKMGGYYPSTNTNTMVEDLNSFYLLQSFIDAKKRYVQDFIKGLSHDNAPTDYILGYEIENEVVFRTDKKPLSLGSGTITTANGGTYNLSDSSQRQAMMDANLVYWIDQVRTSIKQVDPTALVTVGFFSPLALPYLNPPEAIRTYWAIADPQIGGSAADFIDLHMYPWIGSIDNQMSSFEVSSNKKPLIMGEFGADLGHFKDIGSAANTLEDWQIQSCKYNFQGWLTWTWDTEAAHKTGFYSVIENNGTINGVLSPLTRPNPCA